MGARKSGARGRSRRSPDEQAELRLKLLHEAEAELRDAGVHKLSLRSIARRAGVSEAAPYHYFAGKQDLLQAVAIAGFNRLLARCTAAKQEAATADEGLYGIGVVYVEFALDSPAMFRLMFGSAAVDSRQRPDFAGARRRVFDLLLEVVEAYLRERGGSADDAGTAATAAWALVHGLATLLIEGELEAATLGCVDASALVRQVLAHTDLLREG